MHPKPHFELTNVDLVGKACLRVPGEVPDCEDCRNYTNPHFVSEKSTPSVDPAEEERGEAWTRGKKSTRCGVSPSLSPSLRAPTLNLCQRNCSASAQRQPLPLLLPEPQRQRFISKMVVKEDGELGGRGRSSYSWWNGPKREERIEREQNVGGKGKEAFV